MAEVTPSDSVKKLKPENLLASLRSIPRRFWIGLAAVLALYALPLAELVRFSLSGSLYSHVVLIPVVSVYLVITRQIPRRGKGEEERKTEEIGDRVESGPPSHKATAGNQSVLYGTVLFFAGLIGILTYWIFGGQVLGTDAAIESRLAWQIGAFLLSLWGVCLITLPYSVVRSMAFPLGFLVFMVPFPPAVLHGIEAVLQHGSADAAYGLFRMAGTPVFRQELLLELPGINLEVAPECSGIRSSLVLFITSTLAGYMFLRANWKRWVLALFIIPLAMLRNGFRIFVIGELCVRIGPEMIHSNIHRQGGPIFFALSLVPLFVLLWILWKSEGGRIKLQRNEGTKGATSG